MMLRRVQGSSLFRRATFSFMVGFGVLATPISTYAAMNTGNTSDAPAANVAAVIARTSVKPTAEPGRPLPIKIEPRSPNTAEMVRTMELMEERVRQLEGQLTRLTDEVAKHNTNAQCSNALSGVLVTTAKLHQEAPVVLPEIKSPRVNVTFKSLVRSAKALFSTAPTTLAITNVMPAPPKPAAPKAAVTIQQDASQQTAQTPAPASAPQPKDDNAGTLNFFKDVELSGIVDGYYGYNSNKVDLFTQGRAFDVRHNSFSLQLAKLTLERKNSKENPLGFRLDLGVGETVDRIISVSDSSRNDATKHVMQAYASYVAPVGNGLTLDFGKFNTPVGAEVIETKDNFNYTRGWLFAFGPYYHTGLRAKYAINDKVALAGFLVNGWDNLFENNIKTGKTGGFQIALTPHKKFALTQTYLVGKEAPLANVPAISKRDNVRHVADTVASFYVNDKLTLMGNFVAGSDGDDDGVRGKWAGFAGYLRYALSSRFAFSPRFEVLRDKSGLRTGLGQTVKDFTLTQEIKLVDNFITRIEFRRDFSDKNFFTNSAGAARSNQNTFTIGLSYFFSTKGQ